MQSGKIFFVETGPGDVGLLTIKAGHVLLRADVIVYDKSVGDEILSSIPDNAKKIYIEESFEAKHNEIHCILSEYAKQGKCIVCLKGGDPFLFVNDKNFINEFENEQISVEIIPGIATVCDYEEILRYSKKPLYGWNIIVTRPKETSRELVRKLRMFGAKVIEIPTIRLMLVENDTILDVILRHIWDYQWILFTSRISVDAFFRQCKDRQMDARKFSACKFIVLGPETKKRLAFYGIIADLMPESHTVPQLSKELAKIMHRGERVLIVRNQDADRYLIQRIRRMRNALFEDLPVYKMVPKNSSELPEGLKVGNDFRLGKTMVVFSASIEVNGFVDMFKGYEVDKLKAICIGDKTQKIADSFGLHTITASDDMTADEVVRLLLDVVKQ